MLPLAPVAEGGPSAYPTGEPTGLVPRGSGAKGSILHPIESHKRRHLTRGGAVDILSSRDYSEGKEEAFL
jgi:hypothetical protein